MAAPNNAPLPFAPADVPLITWASRATKAADMHQVATDAANSLSDQKFERFMNISNSYNRVHISLDAARNQIMGLYAMGRNPPMEDIVYFLTCGRAMPRDPQ